MPNEEDLRIDKWLWAVRIFKTRNIAAEACKKGRILISNVAVKPSRVVKIGDVVFVKDPPVTYMYKVKGLLGKRQSASIVQEYVEDITPAEEKEKLELKRFSGFEVRDRGVGRPTKKERRLIDDLKKKT